MPNDITLPDGAFNLDNVKRPNPLIRADLRKMLRGALFAEDAAAAVGEYLVDLRKRLDAKVPNGGFIITVFSDGCGSVDTGGRHFGTWFKPISVALAQCEAWLARDADDEVGDVNETLGLSRDGRVVEG